MKASVSTSLAASGRAAWDWVDQIITLKFAILRCKCLKLDDHFYQLLSKYYYRPQLVISPSATVNSPVSFHKSPKHWVLIAGVAIVGCYLEKRKENYKYMNVLTSIIPMWRAETIIGWKGKSIVEAVIRNFGFSSLRALDKHYTKMKRTRIKKMQLLSKLK